MSDNKDLAIELSAKFLSDRERFTMVDRDAVVTMHASGIFYDHNNFAVGYEVIDSSGGSIIRMVSSNEDSLVVLHQAWMNWNDWYEGEKQSMLIDTITKDD